ncbi:MAG: tRNA (adenosine(37)-N6)-threonylcarbamoyltransferase complex transferase subunit TsaD [Candidatus Liptonbacteria bacterium]|nr:tRNA (adenosine(37)-N6)-threonylcarbamoyltransferase complex transferase subunit TsaD [Candidatus Liptonbacteria bacterium]
MLILGIETSCDETSLALVEAEGGLTKPRFRVLKNLVSSQIKVHEPFGGVVPNLAKREHLKNLPILYRKIFGELGIGNWELGKKSDSILNSKFNILDVDLIAVTVGPGLEPALWTGITFAEDLQEKLKIQNPNIKLIGANHLEGHLYSFLLSKKKNASHFSLPTSKLFPAISLIVSGGHTILLHVKNLKAWKKLGETRDDAVGEAFDKVARLLKLPYPGGPQIEKLSKEGNAKAVEFPRPMLHQKNYDFSFSGLKTSVLYFLKEQKVKGIENSALGIGNESDSIRNSQFTIQDVSAGFQAAAIEVLVKKTIRAAQEFGAKSVMLSGGVAANKTLRKALEKEAKKIGAKFFAPEPEYNTDNAAMIAVAGYMAHLRKKKFKLAAKGSLNI